MLTRDEIRWNYWQSKINENETTMFAELKSIQNDVTALRQRVGIFTKDEIDCIQFAKAINRLTRSINKMFK